MTNIFFDCEFTKLQLPLDPEPNELISIGCISENGAQFYAENSCYKVENCSEFVVATVLPLLEGGDNLMHYSMLARQLRTWVEGFDGEVKLWSDAPYFDWQHVAQMFNNWGWPANLNRKPQELVFDYTKGVRFDNAVEEAFRTFKPALRRHHALDDAIANRQGYIQAMKKRF